MLRLFQCLRNLSHTAAENRYTRNLGDLNGEINNIIDNLNKTCANKSLKANVTKESVNSSVC